CNRRSPPRWPGPTRSTRGRACACAWRGAATRPPCCACWPRATWTRTIWTSGGCSRTTPCAASWSARRRPWTARRPSWASARSTSARARSPTRWSSTRRSPRVSASSWAASCGPARPCAAAASPSPR
ncbi:MAG: hypothetical protein AVDCRST_MAG30-1255, partial [uncultured Solirubrobacteraceae bacterium]